jgi:CBS domain-containing protein
MNVVSFMKSIGEVVFVYDYQSVKEAIEVMQKERFTSIPVLSKDMEYIGTITEGDLLYAVYEVGRKIIDQIKISDVKRIRDYESVNVNSTIMTLLGKASNENFVPIVNDSNKLLGIVTRKKILEYFFETKFVVL